MGLPWSAEGPGPHPQGAPAWWGLGAWGSQETARRHWVVKPSSGHKQFAAYALHLILHLQGAVATLQPLPAPRAIGLCLLSFLSQLLAFPLPPSAATSNHRHCFPVSLGDPGLSELSHFPLVDARLQKMCMSRYWETGSCCCDSTVQRTAHSSVHCPVRSGFGKNITVSEGLGTLEM